MQHLTTDQRQAEIRRIVDEIKAQTGAENKERGRTPMTVEQILAQDPHSKQRSDEEGEEGEDDASASWPSCADGVVALAESYLTGNKATGSGGERYQVGPLRKPDEDGTETLSARRALRG